MKKQYSTKKALIASLLALCMCFTMLIGTTFAWFTDSVSSDNNVIQTGKLKVGMYWANGAEAIPTAKEGWKNATSGSIFNSTTWEPGYSEAKHIKITNEGTLALKYQMRIVANGVVSELANVIDVYYFDEAKQLTRNDFVTANKLGTLAEVLNVAFAKNISNTVAGSLDAGLNKTVTLAFKMQESAGNEYQELSIGASFSIQILATQATSEKDSFNNGYDNEAEFPSQEIPAANVFAYSPSALQGITIAGYNGETLDTGYSFQPTETYDQAYASKYSWAHADFFVYADRTVPADSMALAGYYKFFEGHSWGGEVCTSTSWIGLSADVDVKAGKDAGVRLLKDAMGLSLAYNEICNYGNDGTGFLCGAADLTGINTGTTLTVELRVYEVACDDAGCHHNKFECETGEYEVIGTFTHTFGGEYITLDDGAVAFATEDGDVWLRNVANVEVGADGVYYVPDGVTAIGRANGIYDKSISWEVFSSNPAIKTVVFSDSVREIGPQSYKNSAVETVVLNEGLVSVSDYAFNSAKKLKNIQFSSTVTTIERNAFSQIAATEITIPANVTNIGYSAFTSCPNLESVKIEAKYVDIADYAFRSCGKLDEVTILADDINIGSNMAFTNAESNNPGTNDLTFYVQNATVGSKITTAMGVGGKFDIVIAGNTANIVNVATATKLEEALVNAENGDIICLTADIAGHISIEQSADFGVIIDGCGHKYDGVLIVDGGSAANAGAYTVIRNINFESAGINQDAYINLGMSGNNNTRYTKSVTIENCTFATTSTEDVVAIKSYTGGDKNLTVKDCVVYEGMHSFLQIANVEEKLTVENCKVYSKNGANLNSTTNVEMTKCEFAVDGYAVRFGVNSGSNPDAVKTFVFDNCTLKTSDAEGDAVLVFRASAANANTTLTLKNGTTITGAAKYSGADNINIVED